MGRGICLELVVFTREPCLLLGEIVSTISSEKRSLARRVSAMQKPLTERLLRQTLIPRSSKDHS
jgi:hypothetical protein